MKYQPTDAQCKMMEFLKTHDRAWLMVGMGLGKTAAVLHSLLAQNSCENVLVVSPIRVNNLTWEQEGEKWDLPFRFVNLRYSGPVEYDGRRIIYLINYEKLPSLDFASINPTTIVFDETTKAKNPKSTRIKSILFRSDQVQRVWGLTGTPSPNGLLDLFGQARLVIGGDTPLGLSFYQFKMTYFIKKGDYHWFATKDAEEVIYNKLAPYCLVLKSEDYIPEIVDSIQYQNVEVVLSPHAKALYDKMAKEYLLEFDDELVVAMNAAVLVNKLSQVASGSVYTDERSIQTIHTEKIEKLVSILDTMESPTLILCTFQHEKDRLVQSVPNSELFNGTQEQMDRWNQGGIKFLVANPMSMAHGLNLQMGGREIVFFNLPWSLELYQQSIARLARTGQSSTVRVTHLLCKNTIDEVIKSRLMGKDKSQIQLLDAIDAVRKDLLID